MRNRFLLIGGDDPFQAQAIMRQVERGDQVVVFLLRDRTIEDMEEFHGEEGEEAEVTPEMVAKVRGMEAVDAAMEGSIQPLAMAIGAPLTTVDIWKQDDYGVLLRTVLSHIRQRVTATAPGRMYVTECPLHVASAVLTACFLEGVAVTIPDAERGVRGGTADLPILRMAYSVVLTPKERVTLDKVLSLQETHGHGPNFKQVASSLGIEVSTLSKRIKAMAKAGILRVEDHPTNARENRIEATPAGRIFAAAVRP